MVGVDVVEQLVQALFRFVKRAVAACRCLDLLEDSFPLIFIKAVPRSVCQSVSQQQQQQQQRMGSIDREGGTFRCY